MAIYPYKCSDCERTEDVVQSISSYSRSPDVPMCCGKLMVRVITSPMVTFDTAPWAAYRSPIDGEVIDSRAKRNEHMAKHGVVMYDEIKSDFERNRKAIQQAAVADVKQDISEAIHMVEAGKAAVPVAQDQLIPV